MNKQHEVILEWLRWKEHNQGRSPGTINKYFQYLKGLADWLQVEKDSRLIDAVQSDIEQYCGIEAHKRGMNSRSRRPLVAAVKGFFKWAHQKGLVFSDQSAAVPYPRSGRRLPKGMDLHHAEKILNVIDYDEFLGARDAAILMVLMGCGLRLAGVCRLNESDLIWVNNNGLEKLLIRVTEKGDNQRIVPAPDPTAYSLRIYLGHEELKAIDRTLPDGDQVLFVSTMDRTIPAHEYYGEARRISSRSIAEMLEKYGHLAEVPREQCHPHALRHLYGTELTESDVQLLKIQALMGHKDANTTKEYANVALRSLAKVVDESNPLAKIRTPVTELAKYLSSQPK